MLRIKGNEFDLISHLLDVSPHFTVLDGQTENTKIFSFACVFDTDYTHLRREGVKEVNELEARFLCGKGSVPNHEMQRSLGFPQQSIEPNLHIPLCSNWSLQLHSLALS